MKHFPLIDILARSNLKANAAQTYLSYLWWVLEPALYVLLFYVVFELLLLRGSPGFLYFLVMGKIPFLWVTKSLSAGANSIAGKKALMAQAKIPIAILPYASILEASYKQIVVFLVLFAFMIGVYGSQPTLLWWWLIPIMLVNLLLIVAITLPFAWLSALVPDTTHLLPMVTMFLMFTSGIFFDVNEIQNAYYRDLLLTFQPLAFIIDAYRQIVMHNRLPDLEHLAYLTVFLIAVVLFCHWTYVNSQYLICRKVLHS